MANWNYQGKRVVVTRCFSGMGAATARELIALGAEVHGMDYKLSTLDLASFRHVATSAQYDARQGQPDRQAPYPQSHGELESIAGSYSTRDGRFLCQSAWDIGSDAILMTRCVMSPRSGELEVDRSFPARTSGV